MEFEKIKVFKIGNGYCENKGRYQVKTLFFPEFMGFGALIYGMSIVFKNYGDLRVSFKR